MTGETLSHYRVVEQIGAGGMGVVYRAHDLQLERDVALKVLPAGTLTDEAARKRFRKEALSLARLNHPNIATVHEFGSQDGVDFLVTEYIAGITLDSKLFGGALPGKEVIDLGTQLARGLAAAHEQGIVHRDLKPGNLRVTPDGRLKILDFGLAQFMPHAASSGLTATMTKSQEVTGTLPYMAPEQLRGEPSDARTDLWSAGAVLYEMATGQRPFAETLAPRLVDAILHETPPRPRALSPQLDAGLESVILKSLEKDPSRRYQSAQELSDDLQRLSTGAIPLARQRKLRWYAATILAVLLLALALSWYLITRRGTNLRAIAPVPLRRSVAVLGFKNLTGKPDEAWLSTALSEMLMTELAAGGKLLTIPGENVAQAKISLSLPEADSYGSETLTRIHKLLGSDDVVLGSYLALGNGDLRLDLKLEDTTSGEIVDSVTENGTETAVSELVSRVGESLRRKLGVGEVSTAEAAEVKAALPSNPTAARLYSEGLTKLRTFDNLAARDLLQKAVVADPDFALAHSALASAWYKLGYDSKARQEANKALALSAGLRREDQLSVQAHYQGYSDDWEQATNTYATLFHDFPDNLEYGLQLASAQTFASKGKDALATLDQLRKLPAPAKDDPRIDLAEADAADSLSDFKLDLAAATRAAEKAQVQQARLLEAKALLNQCWSHKMLGQTREAVSNCEAARGLFVQAGYRDKVADADNSLATLMQDQGDNSGAQAKYEQALSIWRETGNRESVAVALNNLAGVLQARGDLAGSRKMLEQALQNYRDVDDQDGVASALGNIGLVLHYLGDLPGARAKHEEAVANDHQFGRKNAEANDLLGLSSVLYDQGDLAAANRNWDQAAALLRETGSSLDVAPGSLDRTYLLMAQDQLAAAQTQAQAALNAANDANTKPDAASAQVALAALAIEQGRAADAEPLCAQAIREFQTEKNLDDEIHAHAVHVRALLAAAKISDAQKEIEDTRPLLDKSQNRSSRFQITIAAAETQTAAGNPAEAEIALTKILAQANLAGFVLYQFESRFALAEAEIKLGKLAAGHARLAALEKDARAKGFLLIARKAAALFP